MSTYTKKCQEKYSFSYEHTILALPSPAHMEYDMYTNTEPNNEVSTEVYRVPRHARYYKTHGTAPTVAIIPIRNLIIDDRAKIALIQLKRALGTAKQVSPSKLSGLRSGLRQLVSQLIAKRPIDPVIVRPSIFIDNPSPNDPTMPSIVGLGAPLITVYPIVTSYLYQIVAGHDQVALSMFFGYDYIPIVAQV